MEKLTERQKDILQIVKELVAKNGYAPTVREIGKAAELHSPATIHFHLKELERKGYIRKNAGANRTIQILVPNEYLNATDNVINVPYLEKVALGSPLEAIETPHELFSLPASLVHSKKKVFTLKVSDTSMVNRGIYKGDILVVERTSNAKDGDVVVALDDQKEATVKTFYKEDGHYRLQAENDGATSILLSEITILGKVIGLYRKF